MPRKCKHQGGRGSCKKWPSGGCKWKGTKYYRDNRKKIIANSVAWARANPEKRKANVDRYNWRNPLMRLLRMSRHRAALKGLAFDLDEYIPELQARLRKGICELTGCCLNPDEPGHQCRPSLDRIDCSKGYVYSNVRIVTAMANMAMNTYGQKALMRLGANLIEKEGGRIEVPKDEFTKGNR